MDFDKSIIDDARNQIPNFQSSYGGCGPIATIGMLHYFAKAFDYLNIPYLQRDDKQLMAKYILENTPTREMDDGNTLALPWSCVNGFNKTLKNYNTQHRLVADWRLTGDVDEMVTIIKDRLDKGLPVTFYQVFAKSSKFNDHYVNIYGYNEYIGRTTSGKIINQTLFRVHLNWPQGRNESLPDYEMPKYMDEDVLKLGINGILYYDLKYNEKTLISHDFKDFVNENNQGQYFNEEKSQTINYLEDFSFETKRLRCSYIENEYLVLSTIKKNGVYVENERETAYLEFQFIEPIKKFEYDISMWSGKDKITNDTTGELQYYSESKNKWETIESYNMMILPTKEYPKHFFHYLSLQENAYRIRFIMSHPKINADRNKGRVVLDNLDFCFDNHNISQNQIHQHNYRYSCINEDEEYHRAYCECGDYKLEKHIAYYDEDGNKLCASCDYFEEYIEEHIHQYTYEEYGEGRHIGECTCGDTHIGIHDVGEILIGHCTGKCQYCGADVIINHIFKDHYAYYDENEHLAYCICGDVILREHTYSEDGICIYCQQ